MPEVAQCSSTLTKTRNTSVLYQLAALLDYRITITLLLSFFAVRAFKNNNNDLSFIKDKKLGMYIVFAQSLFIIKYMVTVFGSLLYKDTFSKLSPYIQFSFPTYLCFFFIDLFLVLYLTKSLYSLERAYDPMCLLILLAYLLIFVALDFCNVDVYRIYVSPIEGIVIFIFLSLIVSFYSKVLSQFFNHFFPPIKQSVNDGFNLCIQKNHLL